MTAERLLAAALWLDELDAQLLAAVGRKWRVLGEEFEAEDDPVAYEARDAALDAELVQPLRVRLLEARRLLEDRAAAIAARGTLPAGGSQLSRAYALAKSLAGEADPAVVERDLAELRRAQ
jgi:hypothetical protein